MPRYLDMELADKETPISWSSGTANLEAVHIFEITSIYAVNAAIASGRPLLIRGEPGVGKSQLARAAAKWLQRVFIPFTVDIRTEAQDLLWHFDSVQRLAEAQIAGALTLRSGARSQPILEQHKDAIRAEMAISKFVHPGPLWWAFDWDNAKRQAEKAHSPTPPKEDDAESGNGSVLLIDEIDKAEADVPNGLLEALGAGQFTPTGQLTPVVARQPYPLIVITTNEERALPDAFLRRCMVLNMELPAERNTLIGLLVKRGATHFPEVTLDVRQRAAEQLHQDRAEAARQGRRPLPGQAEYMDLLRALHNQRRNDPSAQIDLLDRIKDFALRKYSATV